MPIRMRDKIQKKWIAKAREAGACQRALNWLSEGHTWRELKVYRPDWFAEWGLILRIPYPPKEFDWCVEQSPDNALEYVSNLLTPERLDRCAERCPWAALEYASNLLTPERLKWCKEQKEN